jgi:hypothetical protein
MKRSTLPGRFMSREFQGSLFKLRAIDPDHDSSAVITGCTAIT